MAKNLEEARKKIAQLSEDLAKLTKTGKAKIFDVNNMREANQAISTLEGAIDAAIQKAEELEEGLITLRTTAEGLVIYIKHNNILYKKALDKG